VIEESAAGDPAVARRRLDLLADIPILSMNSGILSLAEELVGQGPVPFAVVAMAQRIVASAARRRAREGSHWISTRPRLAAKGATTMKILYRRCAALDVHKKTCAPVFVKYTDGAKSRSNGRH